MIDHLIAFTYIVSVILFTLGLKMLSSPETARRGNFLSAVGMFIAITATLLYTEIINYTVVLAGIIVGSALGAVLATKVKMTAMPQMVGLLNGFGGGASQIVAALEFHRLSPNIDAFIMATIVLSTLIGGVTFSGSLLAFAKLQELIGGRPIVFRFQQVSNMALFVAVFVLGVYLIFSPSASAAFLAVNALSLLLGVLHVLPIGGADMPVVIALLNSYSGLAGAATGFVLSNNLLIIAGTLVGASGIILTRIMCRAMNRSLVNVLFSAFGQIAETAGGEKVAAQYRNGHVKDYPVDDAATLLGNSTSVIIVPGYGLAAAQAQHAVRELADILEQRGVSVKYAIHPVAGRMPGHMNVLLAEANVPYDQLFDMDAINDDFPRTDVALVIGANDVVNPAAKYNKASPIYGMPILDVEKAKTVMVLKRSLNPGFAGIDNELFVKENTVMVFGDAKDTLKKMINALKE